MLKKKTKTEVKFSIAISAVLQKTYKNSSEHKNKVEFDTMNVLFDSSFQDDTMKSKHSKKYQFAKGSSKEEWATKACIFIADRQSCASFTMGEFDLSCALDNIESYNIALSIGCIIKN